MAGPARREASSYQGLTPLLLLVVSASMKMPPSREIDWRVFGVAIFTVARFWSAYQIAGVSWMVWVLPSLKVSERSTGAAMPPTLSIATVYPVRDFVISATARSM